MTSTLATNSELVRTGREHFLRSDKNGFPLNKQVPKTYQVITAGNQTVAWDGSDYVVIADSLAAGNLTITVNNTVNNYGRRLSIIQTVTSASAWSVTCTAAVIRQAGSALVVNSITKPAGSAPDTIVLHFYDKDYCMAYGIVDTSGAAVNYFLQGQLDAADATELNSVAGNIMTWDFAVAGDNPPTGSLIVTDQFLDIGVTGNEGTYRLEYCLKVDANVDVELKGEILDGPSGGPYTVLSTNYSRLGLSGTQLCDSIVLPQTLAGTRYLSVRVSNNAGPDSGTRNIVNNVDLLDAYIL